jgi:GT2 family glycosyltransferase
MPAPAPPANAPRTTSAAPRITVGVVTWQRPEMTLRCVRSLALAAELIAEARVVDEGSEPPLELSPADLGAGVPPVVLTREPSRPGLNACRNRIAREARTPYLLFLDDDAVVLTAKSIRAAQAVLDADPSVAVIAFPQAEADGTLSPGQPAAVDYPARVQSFIGFAHLIRRDALLAVGGYRELLRINGEERELSLRLLDAGMSVVYLPGEPVAHLRDAAGRDTRAYLRIITRNDALIALLNEPLPMALASVPLRLRRYFPMRRGWDVHDPGGFGAVMRDLAGALPTVLRQRRGARWATIREWRRLAAAPRYEPPPAA